MLTQNDPASRKPLLVLASLPRKNPTSGGSSEIDAKEPMATPTGPVGAWAVTTVTPVGKLPSTRRKSCGSMVPVASFTSGRLVPAAEVAQHAGGLVSARSELQAFVGGNDLYAMGFCPCGDLGFGVLHPGVGVRWVVVKQDESLGP